LAVSAYAAIADPVQPPAPPDDWSGLERTTITKNPERDELTLELPAVDLPPGPLWISGVGGEFPLDGSIYACTPRSSMNVGGGCPATFCIT